MQWKNTALEIVGAYEGRGYDQVTADSDCQGLSLGIEQSTVAQGSILHVIDKMTKTDFDATVQRSMPTIKATFLEIIDLMRAGKLVEARIKSHELQDMKPGKCGDGVSSETVHVDAARELGAWLRTPEVIAAQRKAADEKQEASFTVIECMLRRKNSKEPLPFRRFLFVYGWFVQGGKSDLQNRYLENATLNVIKNYNDYQLTEKQNIKLKTDYLADWYEAHWSNAKSPTYLEDAKKNSDALRALASTIDEIDIRLLYMRQFRASMGNNPYQLTFMNRGFIDLFGKGWVNKDPFDHTAKFTAMGNASDAARSTVKCEP